jgi:predicted kinase
MKAKITAKPVLFIFAGLPGSGKSTLAQRLAQRAKACYVRIDTIEQALRDLCALDVQGEGYRLAYRVARDNLQLGMSVVADSCNPVALTRREWRQVAIEAGAAHVDIEVVCSDSDEHRHRVETRLSKVPGLRLPTWNDVKCREYDPWTEDRIIIETAGRTEAECMEGLLSTLSAYGFD